MIKLKQINDNDLLTIISYITYSGYKVVVERVDWDEDIHCFNFNISILSKGDAND